MLVFALYLAAALRFDGTSIQEATETGRLLPTALLFAVFGLLSSFAVGLYTVRQRSTFAGLLVRIIAAVANAAAMSILAFYLLPAIAIGRGLLAITAAIAVVMLAGTRLLFERIVDQDTFRRRVLVFGAGRRAASLLELRRRSDTRGFRIIGFIASEGDPPAVPADRLLQRPDDLFRYALDTEVDEIVVAMDDRRRAFPMHEFLECRMAGIDICELPTFLERETGKVRLDVLNPSWIIFGEGFRASPMPRALERGFDVLPSLSLLLLAAPIMLCAALAIRIEDGWRAPIFYRQRRVGRYGETFDVMKFRSMSVNAEKDGAVWAAKNDPRVTRVGAVMRKTRIDELPQLGNVLRGDMSFVGPRPERPEFVDEFRRRVPGYMQKHLVKAGITGWAQVHDLRGNSNLVKRIEFDLFYIENWSVWLDLRILALTLGHVLLSRNAH
jgi:sugar transferase (PEP-CTERM system associated)